MVLFGITVVRASCSCGERHGDCHIGVRKHKLEEFNARTAGPYTLGFKAILVKLTDNLRSHETNR